MSTLYRARVVRNDSEGVFVEIPDLGEGNEWGPLEVADRMPLALGDSVLVGSINDILEDLAAVTKLVTTAYVDPPVPPTYTPPTNASFVLYYENEAARTAASLTLKSGLTTWLDDEQRLEIYTDEGTPGWMQVYTWRSSVLLLPSGAKVGAGVTVPTATLESASGAVSDLFAAARVTGNANPRLTIAHNGTIFMGNGTAVPETFMLRNTTTIGLQVGPRLSVGGNPSVNSNSTFRSSTDQANLYLENTNVSTKTWPMIYAIESGSPSNLFNQGNITGDDFPRFTRRMNGRLDWGNGTVAMDTNLYRQTADTLQTDDTFNAVTDVQVNGDSLPRGLLVIGERTAVQSGVGTTLTATITLPSATFKANRAYRIEMAVGIQPSTTGMFGDFRVFKTNTSTTFTELYRTSLPTSNYYMVRNSKVFKVGSSDVTAVLGLMVAANANTISVFGSASAPSQLWIEDIGPASKASGTGLILT